MSLYETLGVDPKAPANEIRKAYLKKARVCHPDKGGDEEEFQALGRAFAVLSDDDRRKLYDTTGAIDDGTGASAGEGDAYRFWRDFYDRVTSEKLDAMAREYKGSAEEAADLAAAYRRAKGDMDKIADEMLFGTADDEPRYRGLLQAMVDAGELPAHRAFTAESAAKRQRDFEKYFNVFTLMHSATCVNFAEDVPRGSVKLGRVAGSGVNTTLMASWTQGRRKHHIHQ